ncbi:MAG: tetratricopeptide repeat protein [Bacteroidetes bacterium]|jgi:tetratricopeptide (TPR) repeat protein|nr:tetratricopeptide repeat protein [Bacteroidota bacterium]
MRTALMIALLFLFSTAPLAQAQPADSLMHHGLDVLERGVTAGDVDAMQQARAAFERVATAADDAAQAHYYVALANYRIATRILDSDEDRADALIDDGIDRLDAAIEAQPASAEAHALLSTLYGLKARGGMFSGMRYGPRADGAIERAQQLAPENPRVLLLHAVSLLNKPSRWGGDRDGAIAALNRAIQQFEAAPPSDDAFQPRWGHADAYAWLGIAHMNGGDPAQARAAFEQALAVRPGYSWVESGLLPQLAAK